nr:MAG TPA: tail tube protein [Caudoviricetes sp.]
MNSQSVILGTFGKLYMNNVRVANIKSFELKANLQYEDINVNGNLITQSKYKGATLTGTMVVHKIDSTNIKLVKDSIKIGVMPSIKFMGELADPNSSGDEAIEVSDVCFDEATLLSFANGEVREESTAFRAGDYNYLSTI